MPRRIGRLLRPGGSSCPHGACLRGATPRDGSGRHGTATLYAARYPGICRRARGLEFVFCSYFASFVYPIALGMGIPERVRSRRPAAALAVEQLDLNARGERMNESLDRLAAWEADAIVRGLRVPFGGHWLRCCGGAAAGSFPVNAGLPVQLATLARRSRLPPTRLAARGSDGARLRAPAAGLSRYIIACGPARGARPSRLGGRQQSPRQTCRSRYGTSMALLRSPASSSAARLVARRPLDVLAERPTFAAMQVHAAGALIFLVASASSAGIRLLCIAMVR